MHPTLTLLLPVALAACAHKPPAATTPPPPAAASSEYRLTTPITVDAGHHSASRARTTIDGGIEITNGHATATFRIRTTKAPIQCPDEGYDPKTDPQGCHPAPAPAAEVHEQTRTFAGAAVPGADQTTTLTLRDAASVTLNLTCREEITGVMDCTGEQLAAIFGVAEAPQSLRLERVVGPTRATQVPPMRCGVNVHC